MQQILGTTEEKWSNLDKLVSEAFELLNLKSFLGNVNLDYPEMSQRDLFIDPVKFKLTIVNMLYYFLEKYSEGTISLNL
jgi:hypothetical protein